MKLLRQAYQCEICNSIYEFAFEVTHCERKGEGNTFPISLRKEMPVFVATGSYLVTPVCTFYDKNHQKWVGIEKGIMWKDYELSSILPVEAFDPNIGYNFCKLAGEKIEKAASIAIWRWALNHYNIKLDKNHDFKFLNHW
jgi:hypothetical protein